MSELLTSARAAFATIKAAVPSSVVAVVYAGSTAQGVKDTRRTTGSLVDAGEAGPATGIVRCSLADIDCPPNGAAVTVAGTECIVIGTHQDSAGALVAIEYQEQRPVTSLDTPT